MLMLHENEPGAWDYARALEARGVPLDAIPLRADVDPIAFAQLTSYLVRMRPAILHTHLVHADAYGLLAGTVARVPLRFSTKHGFNEFREAPYFGVADRAFASLAHVHIAISRGLAHYLEDVGGIRPRQLRDRALRHRSRRRAEAVRRRCSAAPLRRPPDPDQGPHRAPPRVRGSEARAAGARARDRGTWAARAGASSACARARHCGLDPLSRSRVADPERDRARGRRCDALDGRGLRHGRARGDGALASGHRGLGRRPRRAGTRRRDRHPRRRRGGRAASRCDRPRRGQSRARAADGRGRAPPALARFLQISCTERTELLYEGALERVA